MWNVALLLLITTVGQLTTQVNEGKYNGALDYLSKYGFAPSSKDASHKGLLSMEQMKESIQDFQAFAGLNPTGELDDETLQLMETPRCGVQDVKYDVKEGEQSARLTLEDVEQFGQGGEGSKISSKYILQGSRWRRSSLTYRVAKYPAPSERINDKDVDEALRQAFDLWTEASGITFLHKGSGNVHIELRFERYEHGDGDAFDGKGGTLAHAYFPQFGGDVHIDDSEHWTVKSYQGTNLLQTLVHELGHSLGLSHSNVRESIMAPFYRGFQRQLNLDYDDIKAVELLYGKQEAGSTIVGDLCRNPKPDAMLRTEDGFSYIFQGVLYWRMTEKGLAKGYPRNITEDWPGLPNDIDAAFYLPTNGKTYFFKGNQYWKFDNKIPELGYPRLIWRGFVGVPGNLDAAFTWSKNNKIYFFKGSQYWKYDPDLPNPVDSTYPKSIRDNWGLDGQIVAAFNWHNSRTYFFQDKNYFRFNDQLVRVDRRFPRPTSVWWFGCEVNPSQRHQLKAARFQNGGPS